MNNNSYRSMERKIGFLYLYNITRDSPINNELKTYGVFLDEVASELDDMLDECFLETAKSYGIENKKRLFEMPDGIDDEDVIKELIKIKLSINNKKFNLEAIKSQIKSLGVSFSLTEYPSEYQVLVQINDSYYPIDKRDYIKNEIRRIIPAHLKLDIHFAGKTWEQLEKNDYLWSKIDSLNYTWDVFDNLE